MDARVIGERSDAVLRTAMPAHDVGEAATISAKDYWNESTTIITDQCDRGSRSSARSGDETGRAPLHRCPRRPDRSRLAKFAAAGRAAAVPSASDEPG